MLSLPQLTVNYGLACWYLFNRARLLPTASAGLQIHHTRVSLPLGPEQQTAMKLFNLIYNKTGYLKLTIVWVFFPVLPVVVTAQPLFDPLSLETQDIAGEFAFVRLQYDNYYDDGFRSGTWRTDFPNADANFLRGVSRLTHVRVMQTPIVLRFDDDQIFDYPFLYALEMGRSGGPLFSSKEKENMREYLLRGGFLLIDDFWGTRQWDIFYQAFTDVFPDREIIELQADHEIFRSYYDIDGPQMIPVVGNPENYPEQDVDRASNHAILDDSGRVMVLINWNSDMGDGWEHTFDPRYPTRYANLAYQLGVNYLIYSLTH